MNIQQTLDELVQRAGNLYSLPAVAVEVLELTCRPEVDAHQLKASIERDPALAGKVLRVVNSSLFGLGRPVSDLGQALAMLGIKPLKLLVLGFSLPEGLFANVAGELLATYWRRTLTKAVAARELCEAVWQRSGDEAFLVGLLQDLGELVLIQEVGQPYVEFLATVQARRGNLTQLEREVLGFEHTQLSERLLAHWKLPAALVDCIAMPETVEELAASGEDRWLAQIVYLAELVARLLIDHRAGALEELLAAGRLLRHDLRRDTLEGLATTIQDKVGQLADVLSLEIDAGLDYREILRRAHQQLVSVAATTAEDLLRSQHEADRQEIAGLRMLAEMQNLSAAVARLSRQSSARPTASEATGAVAAAVAAPVRAATALATRPKSARAALKVGEGAVLAQLAAAATACRAARRPLSLLLVEIDRYETLAFEHGLARAEQWLGWLEQLCRAVDQPHAVCLAAREACFALVLPEAERRTAVEIAGSLARSVRRFAAGDQPGQKPVVSVSIGAATVAAIAKNFEPGDLLEKAGRCLYGAQASGGDSIKSIESY